MPSASPPVLVDLPDNALIAITGDDATTFLQGQLSRTVESLDASQAPLAGWLDARGRVRALFRVLRLWVIVLAGNLIAEMRPRTRS